MRYPWSEEEACVKNLRYLNCILSWKQMASATSIQHTSDEQLQIFSLSIEG
jgi:hypothetical protein